MQELLTTAEVCSILRVTRNTLYNYVQRGTLKQIRINERLIRYDKSEIERLLRGE